MGILEELSTQEAWVSYAEHKQSCQHLTCSEKKELTEYINEKKYLNITEHMTEEGYCFDYPVRKLVSKKASEKKRVVYCFSHEEQMVLKCLAFLLYRYDGSIASSCYSFRRSKSAQDAIRRAAAAYGSGSVALKVDISNYFNSISVDELCRKLKKILSDDAGLYKFLERLLTADLAYDKDKKGRLISEKRGAMAGIPVSPFFADIFLDELDKHYESLKIPYFRYSDDCLLILNSEAEAKKELSFITVFLEEQGLSLNREKVRIYEKGEGFDFLGIKYRDGSIDLSDMTKKKMKDKIRRKGRAFYRWRLRNNVAYEKAAGSFIRLFNSKLYQKENEKDFTWSRWFFPLITTDKSLKEIDEHLLEYIRYLSSGRHFKGNYSIAYADIKGLGFKSLVNEYWRYRNSPVKNER